MLKTKDGYNLEVGMVIYDTTGMYEVTAIHDNTVILKEMEFDDDGDYEYTDTRILLHSEVKNMTWL